MRRRQQQRVLGVADPAPVTTTGGGGGGSCTPTASGADLIDDGSGLGFGVYFYLLFSSPNLFLHVAGISDHIKKISFLHVVALPACENPIFAPFAVCGCIGRMQKSLNYTRM